MNPIMLWILIGLVTGILVVLFAWGLRHYEEISGTAALHRIEELEERIEELNGAVANLTDRVENLELIASEEDWERRGDGLDSEEERPGRDADSDSSENSSDSSQDRLKGP